MAKYLCQDCTKNNNGWCPERKINGLKKLGFVKPSDCSDYNGKENADTFLAMRKSSDVDGTPHLTIVINNATVCIPTAIVEDFINGEGIGITVRIPGDE